MRCRGPARQLSEVWIPLRTCLTVCLNSDTLSDKTKTTMWKPKVWFWGTWLFWARKITKEILSEISVIAWSLGRMNCLTPPNSTLAWWIWLSFGYVFCITILAPEPPAFAQKNVFRSPTIQKHDNVHGLEIQKIEYYASKERDWAKSKQRRFVELALVDTLI